MTTTIGDHSPGGSRPSLSPREVEVLRCWIRHDSKAAAASEMFITVATVNTHLLRIRGKYSALNRPANTKAALFARALQDGLIGLDDV
ncbi:LuxR family transcriptional regulator [Rhodococcus hoagii]|uniref:response regulator transcription factor n=1 Tax=Rhodococcus hoagii TaxID=43767 RepID=UPI00196263AC|nr:LuxR C-terminal-related transcriptional regulator [Prescottella equi]MBM9839225.1 LuxR family transcriptional regulator [Prescottella equi]